MLHELLYCRLQSKGTSISTALRYLNHVVTKPALVFVLSDFEDGDEPSWVREIRATNRRHEVIGLRLMDRREWELPDVGWALVQDAESGEVLEMDTSDPAVRLGWEKSMDEQSRELVATFKMGGVPLLSIRTDEKWPHRLQQFLDHCARRRIA